MATGSNRPDAQLYEEQTLPRYHQKRYYPVKIGELLNSRYKVLTKLGYGAYSTVWLATDQSSNQYRCLKICINDDSDQSPVHTEVQILRHLSDVVRNNTDHPGSKYTRAANDIFQVPGPTGPHFCFAMEPHGVSMRRLQEFFQDAILPVPLVKTMIYRLLFSLNFIHIDARIVHTDLSPGNVLTTVQDDSCFQVLEDEELDNPSVPLIADGTTLYPSRFVNTVLSDNPVLTDFGKACHLGPESNPELEGWCMPDLYRAPEVLLGLPWNYQVDVWSLGVMMLELLSGRNVFDPMDRVNRQYVLPLALAQYVGLLGPPPREMLKRSPIASTYFHDDGQWRMTDLPIRHVPMEDYLSSVPSDPAKKLILKFLQRILVWDPEPRATTYELMQDEFFNTPT